MAPGGSGALQGLLCVIDVGDVGGMILLLIAVHTAHSCLSIAQADMGHASLYPAAHYQNKCLQAYDGG